jgi:hypothetical protein
MSLWIRWQNYEKIFALCIIESLHADANGRNQKHYGQTKPLEVVHRTIFEVGEQITITFKHHLDPFCKPRFPRRRDLLPADPGSQSGL